MSNFILQWGALHWIGLAALLFIIEVLTGTGFLLWMAISAVMVGMLLSLSPFSVAVQLLLFSVISIAVAVGWRLYLHFNPTKTDQPTLNKRAEQYIGRDFILQTPVVNGMGQIKVDDSSWRVRCDKDLPAGTLVSIVGADGVVLIAEPVKKQ